MKNIDSECNDIVHAAPNQLYDMDITVKKPIPPMITLATIMRIAGTLSPNALCANFTTKGSAYLPTS